jgi:hypothetical protein
MAAKPSPKKAGKGPSMDDGVVCEPGRHIGCLHAKRAAALGIASEGMDPGKTAKR